MKKNIQRNFLLPQALEEVWQALTNPKELAEWMYPNDFEARVGHRFTFLVPPKPDVQFEGLTVHCEVLKCEPPKELTFTWVAGEVDTQVAYRLEQEGVGTRVYFEHNGFDMDQAFHGAKYGWTYMHGRLQECLSRNRR